MDMENTKYQSLMEVGLHVWLIGSQAPITEVDPSL